MAPKKKRHLESVTPNVPMVVGEGEEPNELDVESPVPVAATSPVPAEIPRVESDVEGILKDPDPQQMVEIAQRMLNVRPGGIMPMPQGLQTASGQHDFGFAMRAVASGARARRESWPQDGTYLTMKDDILSIRKPDGTVTSLLVHTLDITGDDWVVMHFPQ